MSLNTEMSLIEDPVICFPGDRICASDDGATVGGEGTYERGKYIHASLAGFVEKSTEGNNTVIKVKPHGAKNKSLLPVVGDVVTARVEVVNARFARCHIICIGEVLLNRALRGILRREDVRATDIDRVEMYKNYRPNDIILAKIIPQIEIHTFSLSTAENELGVVIASARSLSSSNFVPIPMVPVSWSELQCPVTFVKEPRKVAKIMSENSFNK